MNENEDMSVTDRGAGGTMRDENLTTETATVAPAAPVGQETQASEGHPEPTFGDRLRASRERHGMSLQDCAHALRLPMRLLVQLEADNYEGIDYSVYLRGYLRKYAQYVRLDRSHVAAQLESLDTRQPELVAGQPLPIWARGWQRYSSAFTYIVLTALVVVPLIWLGLNGVLKRDMARLEPLNATPVGAPAESGAATKSTAGSVAVASRPAAAPGAAAGQPSAQPASQSQQPLMASMAPFSAMRTPDQPDADVTTAQPVQATPAASDTRLSVTLEEPSWIQITDASGKRLEYALLPAGTHRAYSSDKALNVRIGNAEGAQVDVDGKSIELGQYQHAKVAHFEIGGDGSIRPDNS